MNRFAGSNGFRLMPGDGLHHAPCTATVSRPAGGHDLLIGYTWEHPADGLQDGILLVGGPGEGSDDVTAAWGDSWHQQPGLMALAGHVSGTHVELAAEYGGGWGWQIVLDVGDRMSLTMHNVIPDEHATADSPAGPYPVMVAELTPDPT